MPTVATRKATLEARLTLVQTAISNALANGHVQSYTTEIQGVTYRSLDALYALEKQTLNELRRLERGTRFGRVGFARTDAPRT